MSKLRASGPRAPEVSIAIGTKWCDLDSRAYFSFFLASAAVATALASLVASEMPLLLTGSAASKAKVVFRGMRLSMPSYIGHYSSPLAYADQMVSDLTVIPLPHGSLASVLFGTLLVWTPSQPHTSLMPQGKLEL